MTPRPPRDQLTEDYDAYAQRAQSGLCASIALEDAFVLQLPRRGRITFGRGQDADVRLLVPSVSRLHLGLSVQSGRVEVADLGSRNGTRVDGEPISAPRLLELGSEVSFGAVRLQLLPESALPSGVRALRPPRALIAHVDLCLSEAQPVQVWALRLTEPFYACPHVLGRVFQLPADVIVGLVDERTLALVQAQAEPSFGAAELLGEGVEAVGHAAAGAGEGRASALVSAALRALQSAPRSAQPAATQRPPGGTPHVPEPSPLDADTERVARSGMSVLIVGETGVGKEVMARAIHAHSGRTGALVSVNAAALPDTLIESELFGHERGAFSGADRAKLGLVEAAQHGTLFLDEIGDLPLALQAKLLRVLEDKKVRPLGATEERKVDVRVVAATHRSLDDEVKRGRFRQDLYFRLNACVVRVPPLRERTHTLPQLAASLLARLAEDEKRVAVPTLSPAALTALRSYAWPGNVRELKNLLERALALLGDDAVIDLTHLPDYVRTGSAAPLSAAAEGEPGEVREALKDYERARILATLDEVGGSVAQAALKLGLPRRTLAYRMTRLGIRTK